LTEHWLFTMVDFLEKLNKKRSTWFCAPF
jgi:hypothetical protein